MPVTFLSNLRHLSATACPSMALRGPFLFPSLKLKHAPFLPLTRPGFSVRALSSSPSSFRAGFSRQRPNAPQKRSRDQVVVRESAKSLVDDEAELSDWANELRTSSYRGKLTSNEDDVGGDRRMRARNDKKRRGSDDEEPPPLWRNSPSRRYGNEYEGPRRGVGDRRFGNGRVGDRRVGDRNKGRSTGFSDSVEKRGTGRFDSVRKVASFSNDDEGYKRGRFRNGDDRRIDGRNKGGSSSFSKFYGRQGRGDSDRVRKGAAFLDENEESDGKRFRQRINDLMSHDETDDEEEEDDADEGLFSKGSSRSGGDRSKGTSFSNSNRKMGKQGVRKTDTAFDEDEEFNMGMLKQGIVGLISEDDDNEGEEDGHVKERENEEKEVNIAAEDSYLSETR